MEQDTKITAVIFRKFKDGEVIAIFPDIAGASDNLCSSYMHVGQHGDCARAISRETKLASPKEYAPLKKELERMGYRLSIHKRMRWPRN